MKFSFADPPYPGQAQKHYSDDPQCAEVDHVELIRRLLQDYPDGWALSTNEPSLEYVIWCLNQNGLRRDIGAGYRIMAWVKPFASFKPNVNPAYAWEPVIIYGGRPRTRQQETVRDWVSANITLKSKIHGSKPPAFCFWLFEVLNARPGDEFVDLYPGSGAVTDAWHQWIRRDPTFFCGGEPTHDQTTLEETAT